MKKEPVNCLICSSRSAFLFETTVMFRYDVSYYQCPDCGTIQTEKPYWLDEAYKNAITITDIGLLGRNIDLSGKVYGVIEKGFDTSKRFLDFGGGYGVLVRLLRDKGLDFYRQDIYCQNIFALNYDISDLDDGDLTFEMATCFEVFEHVYNPYELFEELKKYSSNVLISTGVIPAHGVKSPADWWYIAPETGQHVIFYTLKALKLIAGRYGMNLYSDGYNLHLFTPKKLEKNPLSLRQGLMERAKNKVIHLLNMPGKKPLKSLVEQDLRNAKSIAEKNKL